MELTITTPTTTRDLTAQGFSRDEIAALKALKANRDPYREYCESNREFEQLAFLKWRYEQGAFARA